MVRCVQAFFIVFYIFDISSDASPFYSTGSYKKHFSKVFCFAPLIIFVNFNEIKLRLFKSCLRTLINRQTAIHYNRVPFFFIGPFCLCVIFMSRLI